MQGQESHSNQPPSLRATPRAPRVDLFGAIHKAIRFALCDMLARLGTTDFADSAKGESVLGELEALLAFCERHGEHEDRFFRPALDGRAVEVFADGHAQQHRLIAEVRALAAALRSAPPAKRSIAARTLYLHFASYVAETLAHMADEEQVLQPLLEWMYDDDALSAIHARLTASLSAAEKLESATWMLRAASAPERVALVGAFIAGTSREIVLGMLDAARPRFLESDWQQLVALCARVEGVGR